jgi:hypothetical protein
MSTAQYAVVALLVAVAVVLVLRFEIYCISDIRRAQAERLLSREAWIAVCLLVIPVGGIAYLYRGRVR